MWVQNHLEGWQGYRQHPHPPVRCSWGKLKVGQIGWKANCSAGSQQMTDRNGITWVTVITSAGSTKATECQPLASFFRINHKLSTHLSPWSHVGSRWVHIPVSAKAIDWYLLSAHMLLVLDKGSSSICQSSRLTRVSTLIQIPSDSPQMALGGYMGEAL